MLGADCVIHHSVWFLCWFLSNSHGGECGAQIYIVILCYSIGRNVTRAPPFSYRKNQCLLATSMRAHLLILKTLLIRRDLHNLLIKHAVQHHKCMPANDSSITNRYQLILNCVFPTRSCASRDVDVWRAAMITWFQQLPAIVVTLLPRDPLSRFYKYLWCGGIWPVANAFPVHQLGSHCYRGSLRGGSTGPYCDHLQSRIDRCYPDQWPALVSGSTDRSGD